MSIELNNPKPLEGLRICDFFWLIAGPACSRVFADWGAEVIKVESSNRLDEIRQTGSWPPDSVRSDDSHNGVFNDCNTSKKAIQVDLNTEKGIEVIKRLIAKSDIVTNNFTGERMDRWGLGYGDLKKINPELIMLTMPVMGTTGPQRNFGAIGNNVIALGGINYAMGFPGTPPTGMGPLYSDFAAPYFAASAILAALYHRDKTGEGQFIDLAQFQATASLLGPALLDYSANKTVPERPGNAHPDFAPHGVYPCAPATHNSDRWLALSIENDLAWQRFTELIADPVLSDKSKFATNELRKTHEGLLNDAIANYTSNHEVWALAGRLQDEGITAGVTQDLSDVLDRDPGMRTQHFENLTDLAGRVTYTTHRQPVRINEQTAPMGRAPLFGEHNYEVYTDLLGYSDIEYAELVAAGIVN